MTANTCFGSAAKVRAHVDRFFHTVATRAEEVTQRCRTLLHASAEARTHPPHVYHVVPIVA